MGGAAVAVIGCGVCSEECRIVALGVEYEGLSVERGAVDVACARTDVEGVVAHHRTVVFVAADSAFIGACHGTGIADVGHNDTRGCASRHGAIAGVMSDDAAKARAVRRNVTGDDGGTGAARDGTVKIHTYDAPDIGSASTGNVNGNVVGNVAVGNAACVNVTYDAAGRRVSIAKSGSAFGDLSGSIDSYTYNHRSELTSARRTKNGQPIPGFSEDFDYDPIGNRRSSATYNEKGEAQTSTYEANNLNQYTSRTTPGYAAVRGEADPDASVTVNENPTFRPSAATRSTTRRPAALRNSRPTPCSPRPPTARTKCLP